jgi:hypothetical protein
MGKFFLAKELFLAFQVPGFKFQGRQIQPAGKPLQSVTCNLKLNVISSFAGNYN